MARRNLKKEIARKLRDDVLRGALGRFAEAYPTARAKAYENVEDLEALREQIRLTKLKAANRIDELAARFEAEATRRGAKVFRAADGDALKQYLLQLCREKNVQRIVKSKSMASEEIQLNHCLEAVGLHVKETDLGEWIIALAGHKPSHMVLPAIHLNRQQVAAYFARELRKDIPPEIPLMVQEARRALRDEFLQADLGITGANIGIAESGTIVLCTNEGNARLVTTLPRIHVVIIGYEKLVPTLHDAVPILRTLPRSATAQLATSYINFISGQVPALVKKDGQWVEQPKELHIILLDNGRLKAARDEKLREVYQCVRCASCLNVCPVYALVGGHVYGHIYVGGIGTILTALLHGTKEFGAINELCIGCRRCVEICPGKVQIPDLIEELRARAVQERGLPFFSSAMFKHVLSNRRMFHGLLRAAAVAQKPFQKGELLRHLPLFFSHLTKDRSLPAIAAVPLRDRIAKVTRKLVPPVRRAALFSGCNLDFVFPETGESVIEVLQDLNIEVVFPQEQTCCGKPAVGLGDRATAIVLAKQNVAAFENSDFDFLLFACPTCAETWLSYGELLAGEPEWRNRALRLAQKIREFTSFVHQEYARAGRLQEIASAPDATTVTYHDSCHLRRGLGVFRQPRDLIAHAGCQFVEMHGADQCCGMAGIFGVRHTNLSMPILQQKIANIQATGASVVATACPACLLQLRGGLDKQAPQIQAVHIADLLKGRKS